MPPRRRVAINEHDMGVGDKSGNVTYFKHYFDRLLEVENPRKEV